MKQFFSGLGRGMSDYGPAIRFLFKHKLGWFLLAPLFLNVLIFVGGFMAVTELTDFLQAYVFELTSMEDATFFGAEILSWLLAGTLWLVLKIVFFFIFAYTGGYIVIIIMAPILAYISEKTEQILTGKSYPFDIQQLMRDVVRGVLIALRNLFLELLVIVAFFIIGLIPVIGWLISLISPIVLLLVAAYFYGFSFSDYVNERQRLSLKQSVQYMKKNKGVITGNGLPFALVLLVPVIGLTISGFFAIFGVVASVISLTKISEASTKPNNISIHE